MPGLGHPWSRQDANRRIGDLDERFEFRGVCCQPLEFNRGPRVVFHVLNGAERRNGTGRVLHEEMPPLPFAVRDDAVQLDPHGLLRVRSSRNLGDRPGRRIGARGRCTGGECQTKGGRKRAAGNGHHQEHEPLLQSARFGARDGHRCAPRTRAPSRKLELLKDVSAVSCAFDPVRRGKASKCARKTGCKPRLAARVDAAETGYQRSLKPNCICIGSRVLVA